jgi:hypothetical protein
MSDPFASGFGLGYNDMDAAIAVRLCRTAYFLKGYGSCRALRKNL